MNRGHRLFSSGYHFVGSAWYAAAIMHLIMCKTQYTTQCYSRESLRNHSNNKLSHHDVGSMTLHLWPLFFNMPANHLCNRFSKVLISCLPYERFCKICERPLAWSLEFQVLKIIVLPFYIFGIILSPAFKFAIDNW